MPQRAQARPQFPPAEILGGLNGGLDGYTDPTAAPWKRWFAGTNVFSGQFGYLQRARFANTVAPITAPITSITQSGTGIITVLLSTPIPTLQMSDFINITGNSNPVWGNIGNIQINSIVAGGFTFTGTIGTNAGTGGTASYSTAIGTRVALPPVPFNASFNFLPQGFNFSSLRYYALPGLGSYLMGDSNGKLWAFDAGNSYTSIQRINPNIDPFGLGTSTPSLNGPWSRETLQNILYEMNGVVKQSGRGIFGLVVEGFGINSPDVSPQVTINAGTSQTITNIQRSNGVVTVTLAGALTVPGGNGVGMVNVLITTGDTSFVGTFVVLTGSGTTTLTWAQLGQNTALLTPTGTVDTKITKSIGRSYAYAWENANKPHVSAPSPSTQFVLYNGQDGLVQLLEQGTVTVNSLSTTVTGVGTNFSQAWVGMRLWANGIGSIGLGVIIHSVQSATQLTVNVFPTSSISNASFQIYDPQSTHVRLYATADGQATYFLIQRNAFLPAQTTLVGAGLQFFDNANAEPPAFPYTTEVSQLNNVPPPIGSFIAEYQGRLIVGGVAGALQSFFYSNIELTSIGMPQESFAPLNQYTLPIQNAQLRGWQEMPGAALLWSDRQDMFRLTGQLTDNTAASTSTQLGAQITRLPYNLGIANPFAVDLTPLGAVWVTPQAEVWLYTDSYAPRNIGRPIQDTLNSISQAQLANVRVKYYHNNTRNWLVIAAATSGDTSNNTLLILDLDLLASNGSPSFFVFDMATNQPTWFKYTVSCASLEVLYEPNGLVRLFTGGKDIIEDVDYTTGAGTELAVPGANILTHAWGNDSAAMIKRPTWLRFHTNRDPSVLAADGWSFQALGIDDDYYTFAFPLSLTLTPGVNDTTALSGNPLQFFGSPFRHSPELFRIGGVNFVMGRRIQFQINFPSAPGGIYQFRQIQLGFGPSPPR